MRISALELDDCVIVIDHQEDLPVLAAADVFLFPSLFEGFGGALLEAMAMGLPCMVSDLPALREVGGHAVRYVDVGEPVRWAEALDELLADPLELRRLADAGRSRADRFSLGAATQAMGNWYLRIASPACLDSVKPESKC